MVGFGGVVAYYAGLLSRRSADDEAWKVIFSDLGLDILRIANWYQNQTETGTSPATPFSDDDGVNLVRNATAVLGHAPKIMMSSWTPPAYLQSNASTKNGGTAPIASSSMTLGEVVKECVAQKKALSK